MRRRRRRRRSARGARERVMGRESESESEWAAIRLSASPARFILREEVVAWSRWQQLPRPRGREGKIPAALPAAGTVARRGGGQEESGGGGSSTCAAAGWVG